VVANNNSKTGKFVLIAHGTAEEIARAREIISRTNPEALEEHQPGCATPQECVLTA